MCASGFASARDHSCTRCSDRFRAVATGILNAALATISLFAVLYSCYGDRVRDSFRKKLGAIRLRNRNRTRELRRSTRGYKSTDEASIDGRCSKQGTGQHDESECSESPSNDAGANIPRLPLDGPDNADQYFATALSSTQHLSGSVTSSTAEQSEIDRLGSEAVQSIFIKFRIMIVTLQIQCNFVSVYIRIRYPPLYLKFIGLLTALNFNIALLLSWGCFIRTTFYHELLFMTPAPIGFVATLGVAYCSISRKDHKVSIVRLGLYFLYFVFPAVSTTIFRTFLCDADFDRNRRYLVADYSQDCDSQLHRRYESYAYLGVFVYPLGIPVLFLVVLFQKRGLIDKAHSDPVRTSTDMGEMGDTEGAALRSTNRQVESMLQRRPSLENVRDVDPSLDSIRFLFAAYEPQYW